LRKLEQLPISPSKIFAWIEAKNARIAKSMEHNVSEFWI